VIVLIRYSFIILYLSAFASVIFSFSCFFCWFSLACRYPQSSGWYCWYNPLTFAGLQPASVVLNDKVRQQMGSHTTTTEGYAMNTFDLSPLQLGGFNWAVVYTIIILYISAFSS